MIAAVTLIGQLDRGIMPLLLGAMQRDTHLSDTQLSLLVGLAYSLTYMLAGLPIARIADSGRRTLILPVALATWSLGTALCGLAQGFWQFFLFRGVVGAGESAKGPISVSLIADLVPPARLGWAFGLYNVAIMGGEGLSIIIGGILIALAPGRFALPGVGVLHNWQLVLLAFGAPGLVMAAAFALTVAEPARRGRRTGAGASIRDLGLFLARSEARRVLIPMILSAAVSSLYQMGVGAWRPAFFERTYGVPAQDYGVLMGVGGIASAVLGALVGAPVAAWMSKRWNDAHMRLVVVTQLCSAPLAVISPLMPDASLGMLTQLAASALLMMGAASQLAAMQLITPNEMRSQVNAVYTFTVGVVGQGGGPVVVALVSDHLFRSPAGLRDSMVATAAVAMPIVLYCLWLTVKPYGELHRQAHGAPG